MKREGFVIGIDPDVEKSGLAVLNCATREFDVVKAVSFPCMIDTLGAYADILKAGVDVIVVIEDSDLSTNWHVNPRDNKATAAAKGRSIGMCHATARHLKECAEAYGLEVVLQKPLVKMWRGRDRKITHEEAEYFMRGLPKQTNQEMRDSCLLCYAYADFPIRVKPIK